MNIYMICTLWPPIQAERDWKNSYREILLIPLYIFYSLCIQQSNSSLFEWSVFHNEVIVWKHLNEEFVFHVTINIHYSFILCRIPFSQEDVYLQSFTEQYFIVNELFGENWVKFKIENLPIHLYSESVLHIWYVYCMNRP